LPGDLALAHQLLPGWKNILRHSTEEKAKVCEYDLKSINKKKDLTN
jgi:hypothetical protein